MQINKIQQAVTILRSGGLIGLPTETVYGLAADARNPAAVAKIFTAKGRPPDHPLIVHIADPQQLSTWARDIPPLAQQLAAAFWPGPLTLILKKQPDVIDLITGGQDTVGIRIPSHPLALAVLKQFGHGVAAPSANRFGRISPTTADAVEEELGPSVDLILDGGACEKGIESTIIDCTTNPPTILRPGAISITEIANLLHTNISTTRKDAPRVSGSLESHYAPQTAAKLVTTTHLLKNPAISQKVAVLVHSGANFPPHPLLQYFSLPKTPAGYAHDLYHTLRWLDHQGVAAIWIETVPETPEWAAIADRLQRACSR